MLGVIGGIRQSAEQIKQWFVKEFIRQQQKELDKKIDEMLKTPKLNRIMARFIQGSSIGKRVSGPGMGRSIGKGLKLLGKLL